MTARTDLSVLRRGRALLELGRRASTDTALLPEVADLIRDLGNQRLAFTAQDPWYTNSQSWYRIVEFAMSRLEDDARDEYETHVSAPLGINFTALPDGKSAEVARWLCDAVGEILAATTGETDRSRAHLQELARKLHSEIHARQASGSTHPPAQAAG